MDSDYKDKTKKTRDNLVSQLRESKRALQECTDKYKELIDKAIEKLS